MILWFEELWWHGWLYHCLATGRSWLWPSAWGVFAWSLHILLVHMCALSRLSGLIKLLLGLSMCIHGCVSLWQTGDVSREYPTFHPVYMIKYAFPNFPIFWSKNLWKSLHPFYSTSQLCAGLSYKKEKHRYRVMIKLFLNSENSKCTTIMYVHSVCKNLSTLKCDKPS